MRTKPRQIKWKCPHMQNHRPQIWTKYKHFETGGLQDIPKNLMHLTVEGSGLTFLGATLANRPERLKKKKKKRLPREKLVECTSTMSGLQTTAQLPSNAHGWRGTWARVRWSGSDRPERWSRYLTCQSQRTWPDCLTWPLSLRDYPSEICLRDYPDKFSHRILK